LGGHPKIQEKAASEIPIEISQKKKKKKRRKEKGGAKRTASTTGTEKPRIDKEDNTGKLQLFGRPSNADPAREKTKERQAVLSTRWKRLPAKKTRRERP